MYTLRQLRDYCDGLLAQGVPEDTPCVVELRRTTGFRDADPRRRRMATTSSTGRYRPDGSPDAQPNAIVF